jgi:hypothetical protein
MTFPFCLVRLHTEKDRSAVNQMDRFDFFKRKECGKDCIVTIDDIPRPLTASLSISMSNVRIK